MKLKVMKALEKGKEQIKKRYENSTVLVQETNISDVK
jgi:hypothetical protein